mmetsp:Transcript_46991/g.102219  ORF Transcript_46991/g.102219 Transcript_46991/m.102219 type:complete len:212 (+) Transcript_46991:742-1377(+)
MPCRILTALGTSALSAITMKALTESHSPESTRSSRNFQRSFSLSSLTPTPRMRQDSIFGPEEPPRYFWSFCLTRCLSTPRGKLPTKTVLVQASSLWARNSFSSGSPNFFCFPAWRCAFRLALRISSALSSARSAFSALSLSCSSEVRVIFITVLICPLPFFTATSLRSRLNGAAASGALESPANKEDPPEVPSEPEAIKFPSMPGWYWSEL